MAEELNLDGLTGEFTNKYGSFEDYSPKFLVKLARVYEDTWFYSFHAWAAAHH